LTSKSEQIISRSLREILAGLPVGARIAEAEKIREVLSGLEWFVGEILGEVYPEWERESLDGVYPLVAQKSGEGEAEIFGLCIIISDQTLVPLHLRLQVAPSVDEVSWLECRLGEWGVQGMVRTPYGLKSLDKLLYRLQGKENSIDWVYKVTFGDRRA
jgi:hypothetical protein